MLAHTTLTLLLGAGSAAALQIGMTTRAPLPFLAQQRAASPIMQIPKEKEEAAASETPDNAEPAAVVVPTSTITSLPTGTFGLDVTPDQVQAMLPADLKPELKDVLRRAEFWTNETATLIEIINVVGRFRTASDFAVRTEFTDASYREEDLRQAGTQKRYQMAKKLGCAERAALQQNAPKRPFTDEKLAQSVGLSVEFFNSLPVSIAACNIVFDAIAESRSGLIPFAAIDQRRKEWQNDDGSLNLSRFKVGLAKSRFLVIVAWFIFGKGNFVWVLVGCQFLHDARPDLFPTPKELGLDKIGAIV